MSSASDTSLFAGGSLATSLNLAGSCCNGVATSLTTISIFHPIFTYKTRLMSKTNQSNVAFWKNPYAGFKSNLICDISNQAVAFFAFNFFSNSKYFMNGKQMSEKAHFAGGLFAGIMTSPLLSSLERVMILQQVEELNIKKSRRSILQIIKTIFAKEGLSGFSRGISATIMRESTNSACYFGLSKAIRPKIEKHTGNPDIAYVSSFFFSGALAGFITTPFDLVKTRMQNEIGDRRGLWTIFKNVGLKNMFTGSIARSAMLSTTMTSMGVVSSILPILFPKCVFSDGGKT